MKKTFLLVTLSLLCSIHALASEYHIGPGKTHTTIGSFQWSSLVPGDIVYIYAKEDDSPYYEHLYISAALQGTQQSPIRIIGVNNSNGKQPTIDGNNSTTGKNFSAYGDPIYHSLLGLLVFGPGPRYGSAPQWIEVSNLKIQNYSNVTTTDENGVMHTNTSGSAVYIQGGQNITLDRLTITGGTDGLFAKDGTSPVRSIILRRSNIFGNGVIGSYREHNVYTEVKGITFEFNHFGPPRAGSLGNNIKDRSSGTVIRYNWIEDGGHLLDLVECQDNCADHTSDPTWSQTFIYGNLFYAGPNGPGYLFHYGGEGLNYERAGSLFFYHNTVILVRDQSKTYYVSLFQITSAKDTVMLYNNIFYTSPATTGQTPPIVCLQYDLSGADPEVNNGNMTFGPNWISPGWVTHRPGYALTGTVTGTENIISPSNNDPSFSNPTSFDYTLTSSSSAIGVAGTLPAIIKSGNAFGQDFTPTSQYRKHQASTPRLSLSDMGAFQYSTAPFPPMNPTPSAPTGVRISE